MKHEKTSLEKSHSAWSNFKLTFVSLITSLIVSLIWILIAFKKYLEFKVFVILLVISGFLLLINLLCIKAFKR